MYGLLVDVDVAIDLHHLLVDFPPVTPAQPRVVSGLLSTYHD